MRTLTYSLVLLAGLGLFLPLKAENAQSKSNNKDFSKGFEKFIKLGLPDVTKAKYVKLSLMSHHQLLSRYMNYSHDLRTSGNAWLMREDKKGISDFVVGQVVQLGLYDFQNLNTIKQEERKGKKQKTARATLLSDLSDPRIAAKWEDADLKGDIQAVIEYLDDKAKETDKWKRRLYGNVTGKLFLFCVHIYQKGYKDEANTIVRKIFDVSEKRRDVISQAMNELADGLYNTAYIQFKNDNYNWQEYLQCMQKLIPQFKKGWNKKDAVAKLAAMVKEHIATKTPPELTGKEITPQQQKWAVELAALTKLPEVQYHNMFSGKKTIWILEKTGKKDDKDVIQQIKNGGFASVPFLIAMLKDTYLTKVDFASLNNNMFVFGMSRTDMNIDALFNSMNRPATRGDIAHYLLDGIIIPAEGQQYSSNSWKMSAEEFAGVCENWYEENKGKSKAELAMEYLEQGTNQQKKAAINFLLKTAAKKRMPELEAYFLKDKNALWKIKQVSRYVGRLGSKAKLFVAKFIDHLQVCSKETHYRYKNEKQQKRAEEQQAKQLESAIKLLNSLVLTENADAILKQLVDKKSKWGTETKTLLLRKIASENIDDAIQTVLKSVIATNDLELKRHLLQFMNKLPERNNAGESNIFFGGAEQTEEKELADPDKNRTLWEQVLSDKRTIFIQKGIYSGEYSIAELAGGVYPALYEQSFSNLDALNLYRKLGCKAAQYWLAWAKAKIAKKPLPDFPNVDAGNVKTVRTKLAKAELTQIISAINHMSLSDLLVLDKALMESDLNKKCFTAANKIVKAESLLADAELSKTISALKGKELNCDIIKKLFAIIQKSRGKHKTPFLCFISRSLINGGTEIWLSAEHKTGHFRYKKPGVKGYLYVPDKMNVHAFWENQETQEAAKTEEEDEDFAEMEDEMDDEMSEEMNKEQKKFWDSIQKVCSPKFNVAPNMVIVFAIYP